MFNRTSKNVMHHSSDILARQL